MKSEFNIPCCPCATGHSSSCGFKAHVNKVMFKELHINGATYIVGEPEYVSQLPFFQEEFIRLMARKK